MTVSSLEQDCEVCAEVDDDHGVPTRELDSLGTEFERVYRDQYAFVWRCARRMLAGASEAEIEDLIQDTWVIAYRRFDSFEGRSRPSTWLFGILRNVARNHGRREHRRARRITAMAEHERVAEQRRDSNDTPLLLARTRLDAFLDTLDPDKRAVFVLAELEGQSAREIAEALGIKANTASSRLRAARQQFCSHFELPSSRTSVSERTRPLRERPEQPSDESQTRSRMLLLAAVGERSLAVSVGTLGFGLFGKLAVGFALVMVVGVGLSRVSAPPERPQPAAKVSAGQTNVDPSPAGSETLEVTLAEAAPTLDELVGIPVVAVAVPRTTRGAGEQTPDVNAHALVREARAALVEGRPEQTLELLGRIPAEVPTLRAQRAATKIAALCRLNRGDEARAVADAEPDSPLLARLDSACW